MVKFLCLDEVFPVHTSCVIIGLPKTGKTVYALEQGYHVTKEVGGNILYLGTEEVTSFFLDIWIPEFEKKYSVKPKLFYRYLPSAEELLAYIGYYGHLIIQSSDEGKPKMEEKEEVPQVGRQVKPKKEKGVKIDFKLIRPPDLLNSEFAKDLKENNISYVVVDSVITPFEGVTIGGPQNFPIRANMETMFLTGLPKITYKSEKDIHIFMTNHLTFNPTDPWAQKMVEKFFVEKGGKQLGHYTKVVFGLGKRDTPHGARILHIIRYGNTEEFSKPYILLISKDGYRSADIKEFGELKEEQKAARKEALSLPTTEDANDNS
jgi:hypothetical protein